MLTLSCRTLPDSWIEYRPKLAVFDAIVADRYGSMAMRMASARKLRTDDLFAALGFVLRRGLVNNVKENTQCS